MLVRLSLDTWKITDARQALCPMLALWCRWSWSALLLPGLLVILLLRSPGQATELTIDNAQPGEAIDLRRYSLGQGGLSDQPMYDAHVDQIARLQPSTIRLFVQEYFDLLPEPDRYHWTTLDRSIETILATGAKPILSLCFKPRVLFPEVNQDRVHPTDYAAWERLIEAMVRHCNQERGYGIEYWEVGNEVDLGEGGGCPYRFRPEDYTRYYAHTVGAILRADPQVKVGGPALANGEHPIGDALIDFCGQGHAPLDFFSWHRYSDDPEGFRPTIRSVKAKLARYPRLAHTETIIDEWNIGLVKQEPASGFQAAFVLQATRGFLEEGLSRASYYHIRDFLVDRKNFQWMSPAGREFMADWWNVQPQNSGLFDNQGRRRPAYYAFQMMSHVRGSRLPVTGDGDGVYALAAQDGPATHVIAWNFAPVGKGSDRKVSLRFTTPPQGSFHLRSLNATENRLETVRTGKAGELDSTALELVLAPYQVIWLQVGPFQVHASWGRRDPETKPYTVKLTPRSPGLELFDARGFDLEAGDMADESGCRGTAGNGDVDGTTWSLALPSSDAGGRRQEQSIWQHLLEASEPDTALRLRQDPSFDTEPLLLTFQLDPGNSRGFSVSIDQLLEQETLWIPSFDLLLSTGVQPACLPDHIRALAPLEGHRVLDRVTQEAEAGYADFTSKWEDMGDPAYQNSHSVPPGHVIGIAWDSTLAKFGIDRTAGVISDLGTEDQFSLQCDLTSDEWRSQRLTEGLPVIVTTFQRGGVRYEIEQFAYPLHGPPAERRGDVAMTLLQTVRATRLEDTPCEPVLRLRYEQEFATKTPAAWEPDTIRGGMLLTLPDTGMCGLAVQADADTSVTLQSSRSSLDRRRNKTRIAADLAIRFSLPPHGVRTCTVKLPSPALPAADRDRLLTLDVAAAREETIRFWDDQLGRGSDFRVPETVVNELYRASLWHALRLPRRYQDEHGMVDMDLPYSNFAYGQTGKPWPVNHAVYVDYMLYDLRGYHDVSREELLATYRTNQQQDGRIGGFANWGVYTPSMIYASAQHYLLSRDRDALDQLLPPMLRAADWCLRQRTPAESAGDIPPGLMLAPLNDLSHDTQVWAFNQAYMFAAFERLAPVLQAIEHPRAEEMRAAAEELQARIATTFARASMLSPLVQLRDHTWCPYVPSDALTPRRRYEDWYPTDVDTGPLHLPRLRALPPSDPLVTAMLHDHEDNLFLKSWGMANEPVYNQQALTYLLRDEPEAAIRAFYSMLACAFSHGTLEPVEHRWGWGQYFGPPSTDGAWFELYRHMLIHERPDGSLLLGQATPRAWLESGKQVEVRHAPSYYGPLNLSWEGLADDQILTARVELTGDHQPAALLVRLRHPRRARMGDVTVNDHPWSDFDPEKEWVRIEPVRQRHYVVRVRYEPARD